MKVKLLKKVRKRFEICHYPKGITRHQIYYEGVFYTLYDNKVGREYRASINTTNISHFICASDYDCINALKQQIINILNSDGYPSKKRNEITVKKIWYV